MRHLFSIVLVAGLAGGPYGCYGSHEITGPAGPSYKTSNSNGSVPEVPAGQHPQPNPQKSRRGK